METYRIDGFAGAVNGSKEPKVHDAAVRMDVRFGKW
jgi:hypothetical protein